MATIKLTDVSGDMTEIEAEVGLSVMEIIRDSGNDELAAICGGCCSCATCHVFVDAAWYDKLETISEDEKELVSETEYYAPNSRLSCQIEFTDALDGLAVTVAPEE